MSASIDAVLIREGTVKGAVEVKSRNMSLEKLKSLGSYMISLDKINKGSMIASRLYMSFFVFVFLIPDKRIFF